MRHSIWESIEHSQDGEITHVKYLNNTCVHTSLYLHTIIYIYIYIYRPFRQIVLCHLQLDFGKDLF